LTGNPNIIAHPALRAAEL